MHFHFNAWAKHDDWQKDRRVPETAARLLGKRLFNAECNGKEFIIQGGGIEVNGRGTLLTTEQCYLDPKIQVRNPGLGRQEIEETLGRYLGVTNVFWLAAGPVGDDTHGHIDDICRFVNPKTVVLIKETSRRTPITVRWLRTGNASRTCGWRTAPGRKWCRCRCRRRFISPATACRPAMRTSTSPTRRCSCRRSMIPNDRIALGMLGELFKDRPVIGLHAVDLVLGRGTVHCLTQQQPA